MGLYYETVRSHLGGSDSAVCTAVVADLQQNQDAEFEELLTSLYGKVQSQAMTHFSLIGIRTHLPLTQTQGTLTTGQ